MAALLFALLRYTPCPLPSGLFNKGLSLLAKNHRKIGNALINNSGFKPLGNAAKENGKI